MKYTKTKFAEDETMTEKNSGKEGITRVEFNQALKEVANEFENYLFTTNWLAGSI